MSLREVTAGRKLSFFADDYRLYWNLMAEWCNRCRVEVWAYCLMPNHIYLLAVPESKDGLRRAIGEADRRYTRHINFREGWKGHLWQGRFNFFPMDENYFIAAARYVELNPVRARIVSKPEEYPWSSASAHFAGKDDLLVKVAPLLEMVDNWTHILHAGAEDQRFQEIRRHECTGRPLGSEGFVERIENALGRCLRRSKPGPKAKSKDN